jgi:hypothetical protein
MATATKRRAEKTWHADIGGIVNGVAALKLTAVSPTGKAESFSYYVSAIPADFGSGYLLERFPGEVEPGAPDHYHVNIGSQTGRHSCECRGWLRWSHRTLRKHVRACLQLHARGLLPTAQQVEDDHAARARGMAELAEAEMDAL